jgi:hypothetical protein
MFLRNNSARIKAGRMDKLTRQTVANELDEIKILKLE